MEQQKQLLNFYIHIKQGYFFRHLISMLDMETRKLSLILSPASVVISVRNVQGTTVYHVNLKGEYLNNYIYNARDDNGELLPEYVVSFEGKNLQSNVASISRTDQLFIYQYKDNPAQFNIKINYNKSIGQADASFINVINEEPQYNYIEPVDNLTASIRLTTTELTNMCQRAIKLKCSFLEIQWNTKEISFTGINSVKGIEFQVIIKSKPPILINQQVEHTIDLSCLESSFADSNDEPIPNNFLQLNIVDNDLTTVLIPLQTIKALVKIGNIAPKDTPLSFFFTHGKVVRMKCDIGNIIGSLLVAFYLKS